MFIYFNDVKMGSNLSSLFRRRRKELLPDPDILRCLEGAVVLDAEWEFNNNGNDRSSVILHIMTYELQKKMGNYINCHENMDIVEQCKKNLATITVANDEDLRSMGYSHSLKQCCQMMIVIIKFGSMRQGSAAVEDQAKFDNIMYEWIDSYIVGWFSSKRSDDKYAEYESDKTCRKSQVSTVERKKYTNKTGGILTLGCMSSSICKSYALEDVEMYLYQMSTRHSDMPRLLAEYLKKDSSSVG